MPTYVALLRAINVTGRFVKMQALAEAFVRRVDELRALADRATAMGNPLPAGAEVNVCFLPVVATPEHSAALALLKSDIDDFEVHGREVYWRCLTRHSNSKFSNAVLERRLKLRTTLRRARRTTANDRRTA